MRAALLALALMLAPLASAQENIRGVCIEGGSPVTAHAKCVVKSPGQYEGGDTLYLNAFATGLFAHDANSPSDTPPLALADQAVHWWNVDRDELYIWDGYHSYLAITPPSAAPATYVSVYAKAGAGLCAKDSSGTERCTQAGSSTPEPVTLCTHLASLASGGDSFIAPIKLVGALTKAWCITTGTITTAPTLHIAECSSTGIGCVANTTAVLTCDADGDSTTTFGGAGGSAVDADDWMQADITNSPSVTAGVTTICFSYTPS